jgi:DNA-binding response OmpR family regulator
VLAPVDALAVDAEPPVARSVVPIVDPRVQPAPPDARELSCGDVALDLDAVCVYIRGQRVLLPYGEFELLHRLIANEGRAMSRSELAGFAPDSYCPSPRIIDVRIGRLRRRLATAHRFKIETVVHVGYRCVEVEGPGGS